MLYRLYPTLLNSFSLYLSQSRDSSGKIIVDEIELIVDANEFFETQGEVCTANWKKGQKGMKPTAAGVASYLASESDKL
jgi:alkyl hydroperoxide reductase subunit AhpC